jgi:mxaJ protein
MISRTLTAGFFLFLAVPAFAADQGVLRICLDPDDLPFSNKAGAGFENRVAELLALDLGLKLEPIWRSHGKDFVDQTLNSSACDALMGVPDSLNTVAVTAPYYRSTYVLLQRSGLDRKIVSLSDPALAKMKVGIAVFDNEHAPPAQMLRQHGLSANVTTYNLSSEGQVNPPSRIVDAVSKGEVDVAIVWGPLAGFFARHAGLTVTAVPPADSTVVPVTYAIAVATRKADTELRDRLNHSLQKKCPAIQAILDDYGIPQPDGSKTGCVVVSN